MNTLEHRISRREEAISSLQKIPILAIRIKESAEWERPFWEARLEQETAKVREIAEEQEE